MSRHALLVALALVALHGSARAGACPPAVALAGDPELIAAVGELLVARGIALEVSACGVVKARIERRGGELVIEVVQLDGTAVQRVVNEAQTATTVIESFTRMDVGDPLLASRAAPVREQVADVPSRGDAPAVARAAAHGASGVHVFGAFETSVASDRTSWFGAHVGACIMLGRVCAAARLRHAGVLSGPGRWREELERRGTELLVGIDIPFAIGRGSTLAVGFAAGIGQMHTRSLTSRMRTETGGIQADVHATLSIKVSRRYALDVFMAADLAQETRAEWGIRNDELLDVLPRLPRMLWRFGLGVRRGGP